MITNLDQIIEEVKSKGKKRLAVAYAEDSHTLGAVSNAVDRGIVDAILVGNPENIKKICAEHNIDAAKFTIVEGSSDVKCVEIAVKMIKEGEADVLMKGLVSNDKYMRGILNKEYGLVPPKGTLSHVTVIQVPAYHKLLTVADVAIIPAPDLKQKIQITKNVIAVAKNLGIECPKVAAIAPTEQMLDGIPSCVDAAILAKHGDRGTFGKALVDGPLALDVAIDPETVKTKKLVSSVAGDADCLVFPNLESGNVFFKACTKFAKAELAAMIVGAKAPCVLTSRGDSEESKLYSIALAVLSAK